MAEKVVGFAIAAALYSPNGGYDLQDPAVQYFLRR